MPPLVSILIPAYNAKRWISDTVTSALAQTWPHKEIIVVEDGSTDETVAVARRFESPGVKVVQQENRGPAATRNHAYRLCQGEYIQFLDADDLLSPDKISEQIKILQDSPPGMLGVCPSTYFQDGSHPEHGVAEDGWPVVNTDAPVEWLTELLGPDGPFGMVPPGAWLTPRQVAENAGPWDETPSPDDDGEYFARVVLASAGIRRAAAGRFYYRKHACAKSWSSSQQERKAWACLHTIDSKARHLLARTSDPRAKRALANCYMRRAVEAYPDFPEITRQAIEKARQLGGASYVPPFGSWRGQVLSRLIGWKATRRMQSMMHRYKAHLQKT